MTTRATHGLVDLIDGYLQVPEVSAPGTPASAKVRIYAKSDGHLYIKDDAGTEYDLTAALNGVTAASAAPAADRIWLSAGANRTAAASAIEITSLGILQATAGAFAVRAAAGSSFTLGRAGENTSVAGTLASGAITSTGAIAGTNLRSTLHFPPGQQCANLTATCTYNDGEAKFVYLGRARAAITTLTLRYRVTTAYVDGGSDWAEVAVFKGNPSVGGNASLTLMGYTDVSAVVNSTGQKSTAIALTGVAAGDELWACLGQNGNGTKFILRGCLADDLQTGYFQTASVQPSAAASPQATTLGGATAVPPWCAVEW